MPSYEPVKNKYKSPFKKKSNSLENKLAYFMAQQQAKSNQSISESQQQAGNIGQMAESVSSQFGGKPPVGTSVSSTGAVNVDLNRKLTQDERADLDNFSVVENFANELESLMDSNPQRFQEVFAKASSPGSKLLVMGDNDAVNIWRKRSDMADRILRARSKSQTTEKEFSRIRGFAVPGIQDLTVSQDPETGETFPTIREYIRNVKESSQRGKSFILNGSLAAEYGNQDQGQLSNPANSGGQDIESLKQRLRDRYKRGTSK